MINYNPLKRCMERAENGEELTIGFFGGSITQGSFASNDKLTYAYRVFEWWEKSFPKAQFHYVNGGIGGTTSHFGVSRVVEDLLMYYPDVVVVDFSVNDEEEEKEFFKETYEGLIRKILSWPSHPAVLVLNNVYYDTGSNVQDIHNEIADHYGIVHVSIKDSIYQRMSKGEWKCEEITPDNLHPTDLGHELVADEICKVLEQIKGQNVSEVEELILPAPLTQNAYETAKRLTIKNSNPELMGFRVDAKEKMGHLDFFKNGWMAKRKGDKIRFEVEASCIAIQYKKTIKRPAPVAKLTIDGEDEHSVLLDGNFDKDWGDCLFLQKIMHHQPKMKHQIEIEIVEGDETIQTPFYILSLIIV